MCSIEHVHRLIKHIDIIVAEEVTETEGEVANWLNLSEFILQN